MRLVQGLSVFLLAVVLQASLAAAQDHHWVFTFEVLGGPPGSTHLLVNVSDDGTFVASSQGVPITEAGLTKHAFTGRLSANEVSEFVELARADSEFILNPEEAWPDCKTAEMMVIKGREKIVRLSGCIDREWEGRRYTKELLAKIEAHLPAEMRHRP